MTYSQSPKITALMKQASTRYVEMCLEGGGDVDGECAESSRDPTRLINRVRGVVCMVEGHGRLPVGLHLCSAMCIFL